MNVLNMRVVDYCVNYVCEVKLFPEVCGSLNLG